MWNVPELSAHVSHPEIRNSLFRTRSHIVIVTSSIAPEPAIQPVSPIFFSNPHLSSDVRVFLKPK